jgi:hypothetical protein
MEILVNLIVVLYFAFIIMMGILGIHSLYCYYRDCKKKKKEWNDFLDSLTPNSKWVLDRSPNKNPFYGAESEKESAITAIILETRVNYCGDVWVRYKCETKSPYSPHFINEKSAYDFKKIYTKLAK